MNQESFSNAINGLKEIAKSYENMLAMEDIKEELKELELSEEQLQAVYDYLIENNIQIVDYVQEKKEMPEEKEEDSRFLKMYMEDIRSYQDISKERLKEIFWKAVKNDETAKEELIAGYLKRIVDFARIYRGQGVLLEDLIQEGNMGLLNGLYTAKEQSEIEDIESYLMEHICRSMEEAIYEIETETRAEDYIVKQIDEVDQCINEFEKQHNRKPLIEELAELLKKDAEEVEDIMRYLK